MCFLTLGAFIDHKFVFDKLSEDLVAAAVFEASDGGQETHRNNLMVLHPHFNLHEGRKKRSDHSSAEMQTCLQK